jgi:hypothetical protein
MKTLTDKWRTGWLWETDRGVRGEDFKRQMDRKTLRDKWMKRLWETDGWKNFKI